MKAMLYPLSGGEGPDAKVFAHPGAEYRCAPFWAWNCDLEKDLLLREIACMQEMGMGGFHMHTRCGMSLPYLGDEFMDRVRLCVDEAKKRHMLAWLYDEDKWPSGFAGGYVTEKEENRQRFLLLTPHSPPPGEGRLLARYTVSLDGEGYLKAYRRLGEGEETGEQVWHAVLCITKKSPWFHFRGYADTMNPSATEDFIRVTHERYRAVLGEDLGTVCPAIFTDEPQMTRKTTLSRSTDLQDVVLSWTEDLEDSYRAAFGESLLDRLPEVVWEQREGASLTRYRYHDHTAERFVSAFCDRIGAWCRKNGILMTGHMMDEGTLQGQAKSVGEVMRAYRAFTLPGVDQLCDGREFTTVKQAASAAHQQGCPGVASELYGVTNWDFDFKGHKLQGDWQAALGVTVRVPHLYWCSMHGESKRDYPASIGHQSPWWREYPFIEDHFARVNVMMTRGRPLVRIGVIHPVESCWIAFGPDDLTGRRRAEMDRRFQELTRWLLADTLDFDFICESTLPQMHGEGDGFRVGRMSYDAVIVPGCETVRRTTLEALAAFRDRGGRVIFLGALPRYVDALPCGDAAGLAERCECLPWDRVRLNESLAPLREVHLERADGKPAEGLLCALREDGGGRNVFICHAFPAQKGAPDRQEAYRIVFSGHWRVSLWDTFSGNIRPLDAVPSGGKTALEWTCWAQDSLLLRLTPAGADDIKPAQRREAAAGGSYGISMSEDLSKKCLTAEETFLPLPERVIPDEDNVLVLDRAEWRTDDGPWHGEEDMLRIGVAAKELLGISTAAVSGAQPWVLPKERPEHTLRLRITFRSLIDLEDACLAMEDGEVSRTWVNGREIPKTRDGWFTDECIGRYHAGRIRAGLNTVETVKPIAASTCTENLFLLGRFGVRVTGPEAVIVPPGEKMYYCDWTQQGWPFYSGRMTYRVRFRAPGGRRMRLRLGRFSAPCVTVSLDGGRAQNISLAPSEADLGFPEEGEHILDITVHASRINAFGTLHLNDPSTVWFGPAAWRPTGLRRTLNYCLAPSGLLSEPMLLTD